MSKSPKREIRGWFLALSESDHVPSRELGPEWLQHLLGSVTNAVPVDSQAAAGNSPSHSGGQALCSHAASRFRSCLERLQRCQQGQFLNLCVPQFHHR